MRTEAAATRRDELSQNRDTCLFREAPEQDAAFETTFPEASADRHEQQRLYLTSLWMFHE